MWFWWFMLISSLLIPALMITAGWFMWKRPPKKINSAIGYRTSRSMKNINTWQFAHHYCGQYFGYTSMRGANTIHCTNRISFKTQLHKRRHAKNSV